MKSAIVVFPGSNRERDISMALERSTGRKPDLVWHRDTELPDTDLIVIPGGFACGDYLRCGAMAAHSPIMREIARRAGRGTPVLGIFNEGKTVLGLMPHPEDATDELLGNIDGRGLFDGMARALMGASAA